MISALVPFPDGAQAIILYTMAGFAPMTSRLWFFNRQPPTTATQVQSLADGLAAYWVAHVMPLLAPQITLSAVVAWQWDVPEAGAVGLALPGVPGGAASRTHSANVSVRVTFSWPSSFHNRLGSNFVPGIPIDAIDGNLITDTFRHDIREAYIGIIDQAAVWGPFPAWRWVNASLQVDHAPRAEALVGRVDFIRVPSQWVSPRRYRLHT